ncbi:hypothetical protein L9W86_01375, partial [Vibrio aestuarianus]|nr:hypothetical protein [Vibrio aestuarianus]
FLGTSHTKTPRGIVGRIHLTNDTATSVKMAHALLTSAMFWLILGVAIQTVSFFLHGFDGALPSKDSIRPIVNIFTIKSELI